MFGKSEKRFLNKPNSKVRRASKQMGLFCARFMLLAFIVLMGAYALDYARHSAQGGSHFKLDQIHYQGVVQLDRQALDPLIYRTVPENVLLIDLDRLRDLVESESWVKEARIRRKLPNRLFIHIVERQPAAVAVIDSELYVVDSEGVVLDRYGPRYQSIDRPIAKGLQNVARENAREENALRMQIYLRVLEELKPYDHSISEIDVENPERVAVIPEEDPVHIYLGNEQFSTRYEIFVSQKDLYERLKKQYGTIESVDVTYDNKIIFHTPDEKRETITAQGGKQS